MTYWSLNFVFLGAVAMVAVAAMMTRRGPRWKAIGVSGLAIVFATAIFDNVMIKIGLVGYNPRLISGALIGVAPIEDFAYALAAVVVLPSLWSLIGSKRALPS